MVNGSNNDALSLFQKLLEVMCIRKAASISKLRIVQVGANDGRINDPLYTIIKRHVDSTSILLIEPQVEVVEFLRDNYSFHREAIIWSGAIGATDRLSFYRLMPEFYDIFIKRYLEDSPSYRVPSGFTSTNYDHVLKHIAGNLPKDLSPEDVIEEVSYRCAPLLSVIDSIGWSDRSIDVLQVDAEGGDDEVLYASSLSTTSPVIINYEHLHLGRERQYDLTNYLGRLGYKYVIYDSANTMAIHAERAGLYGVNVS